MTRVPAVHVWSHPDFKDQKDALIKSGGISSTDAKKEWKDLSSAKQKAIEENYRTTYFEKDTKGKVVAKKIVTEMKP